MPTFIKNYSIIKNRRVGLYKCDCGLFFTAFKSNVNFGTTKSCGCLRVKNMEKVNKLNKERYEQKLQRTS